MAATPRAIGGRKNGGPKGGGRTVGNYTLLETVGQGTFGEVMIAVEKHTRESVAVKVLERDKITDDAARERLVNEIAILNRVHHANLLQLLEVIEDVDRIYLITEYIGGGELFNYIVEKGRLEESEAARLFAQMVAAVDSCHRNLVIHRDLKPENVLLDPSGDIKVIDFGLGAVLSSSDELLTVACGSPHYAAPEMLLGGGYYGQRVDMWSLGVCLYAMLCGCLPFDEPEMDDLYDRIIDGDYDFSPAPELSPAARDLVCGLLHMPPEERLTARAVLNHKWMRSAAPTPPATLGLLGAVLDPACRQLLRKMESEFGFIAAEVLEGLRRGERSPATAIYWLLRQRELKRGSIQHYAALLPRPPPARNASVRRRPVPGNIRAAAAKLPIPQALPSLPLAALGSNVQVRGWPQLGPVHDEGCLHALPWMWRNALRW
uniref:Protein kinase domain-containing protein n=1 Tax=Chrysotila carterae TaxID=13221 RepID=A0A7S4BRA7_CHRCT